MSSTRPVCGRVHLDFYRVFVTKSRNIADRQQVARIVDEAARAAN